MRQANVYVNNVFAGTLFEENSGLYTFRYDDAYFYDQTQSAISPTLPKTKKEYCSSKLFPFFFNLISEGENKKIQEERLNLDTDDFFGLLLKTAGVNVIGSVTLQEISDLK